MGGQEDGKDVDWKELGLGKRRMDRHRKKTSAKSVPPESPRKKAASSSWYRRPSTLGLIGAVVIILAAAGGAAALLRRSGGAPPAATGTTTAASAATTTSSSSTDPAVARMSLEEKVGQMMMIGFDGTAPDDSLKKMIQDRHIGAVILYGPNISSHDQVAQLDSSLQQLAAQAGQPAQLMIATDQEGGKTRRFMDIGPNYSEPFIGSMRGGAGADSATVLSFYAGRGLKDLGINTDLAPVADVTSGYNSVMDTRSYGDDPKVTAELVAAAVKGFNDSTTISCVKHFPGLGSAEDDPEQTLPTITRDLASIQSTDLPPFQAAIKADVPMIMVGHEAVPALDPAKTPASLSRPIITGLLRSQLGFQGVIITDDLEMGAITASPGDAAVAAIAAGADMVMFAHTPAKQQQAYDAIIAAVKSGKLKEDDIDKSVERILKMKRRYRLEALAAQLSAGLTGTSTTTTVTTAASP